MAVTGLSLLNISVDLFALAVTWASLLFVLRQKPSQYPYLRSILALVHVFFGLVVVLDVMRHLYGGSAAYIETYSFLAPDLIYLDVALLTTLAYSIYMRPGGRGVAQRLKSMFFRWPHGLILGAFMAFIASTEGYLTYFRPYTIVLLTSLGGSLVPSPKFNSTFLALSLGTLAFFLAYPTLLLVKATSQSNDPGTKRRLFALPFCWFGIGAEVLVFNGFLVTLGYDLIPIGYSIAGILFGVTAAIFRRASLLSTFFEPVHGGASPGGQPLVEEGAVLDVPVSILLEVDPSSRFESAVASLARKKTRAGGLVYVFSSRGSPVYKGLAGIEGVRFYVMTSGVSYPSSSDRQNELLVPRDDMAVMLDLIDKTISSTSGTPVSLVFDSISDFIIYQGLESTYKFLKQSNEITSKPGVSAVYLLTSNAHDERVVSLIRSLFRMHATYDQAGIRVTKGAPAAGA